MKEDKLLCECGCEIKEENVLIHNYETCDDDYYSESVYDYLCICPSCGIEYEGDGWGDGDFDIVKYEIEELNSTPKNQNSESDNSSNSNITMSFGQSVCIGFSYFKETKL